AFAKISYDTDWLKRYYPAHYTVGVLNNQPMGFYSPAVVINDAKRHGIRVLPIDVNESAWEHDTRLVCARGCAAPARNGAAGASAAPLLPEPRRHGTRRPSQRPRSADARPALADACTCGTTA